MSKLPSVASLKTLSCRQSKNAVLNTSGPRCFHLAGEFVRLDAGGSFWVKGDYFISQILSDDLNKDLRIK